MHCLIFFFQRVLAAVTETGMHYTCYLGNTTVEERYRQHCYVLLSYHSTLSPRLQVGPPREQRGPGEKLSCVTSGHINYS